MTDDRFMLADFIGRQNRPTLSINWRPLKMFRSNVSPLDVCVCVNCRYCVGGCRWDPRCSAHHQEQTF